MDLLNSLQDVVSVFILAVALVVSLSLLFLFTVRFIADVETELDSVRKKEEIDFSFLEGDE